LRALVFRGPGSMPLEHRHDPVAGPGQVVVAVRASGVCGSDVHGFMGATGRRRVGVVMGHEAAGVVAEIGDGVDRFAPGDRVVLRSILACGRCDRCLAGEPNICRDRLGLGMQIDGAYAERVVVPEAMAEAIPGALGDVAAALVEPLAVAMHAVAITPFGPDDTVVIVGGGSIGLLTLLAVRRRGAGRVVVTDRDAHRLAVARQLGAGEVVDVATADPVAVVDAVTDGRGADAVFEAVGIAATVEQSIAVARPGGQVTWVGNSAPEVPLRMQQLVTRELTIRGSYAYADEFEAAIHALATRTIDASAIVETTGGLEEAEELFRSLAAGTLPSVKVVLTPTAA
jgi:L-iditol 2-dehydrogenase